VLLPGRQRLEDLHQPQPLTLLHVAQVVRNAQAAPAHSVLNHAKACVLVHRAASVLAKHLTPRLLAHQPHDDLEVQDLQSMAGAQKAAPPVPAS